MVWDKWGIRKKEYDRVKKYKRTKESEGLFNRAPSSNTLFKANTDSQSWDSFSFTSGNFTPSPADIKAQLDEEQLGIGSCLSNKQCPTGYACIDGKCVKIYTKDGTSWGTCGDERLNFPCKEAGPKTTNECSTSRPGPGDCQESGCGSGPKCCRQDRDGSVSCYCGFCEDVESGVCSVYCDTTYKLFGTVSSGCSKNGGVGNCEGNICIECAECVEDPFGGPPQCQRYERGDPSLPCHCVGCDGPCERCQRDPNASNFNDCYFDANNCYTCCSVTNPDCDGRPLTELGGSISACTPYLGKSCQQVLSEKIAAACAEKDKEPDPCAPTGSDKYCVNGSAPLDPETNPAGPAGYVCPPGKRCTYTGFIEGGGQTCYLYNTWVADEIPADCEVCDCNCENDCGDCQFCNAEGICEAAPECGNLTFDLKVSQTTTESTWQFTFGFCGCAVNSVSGPTVTTLLTGLTQEEVNRYGLQKTILGPPTAGAAIVQTCVDSTDPNGNPQQCAQSPYRDCAVESYRYDLTYDGVVIQGAGAWSSAVSGCTQPFGAGIIGWRERAVDAFLFVDITP